RLKISRERESEADRIAKSYAGDEPAAAALVKTAAFSELWQPAGNSVFGDEPWRRPTENASLDVSRGIARILDECNQEALLSKIGEIRTVHPTDEHPPTIHRLEALGLQIGDRVGRLHLRGEAAATLVGDLERLEEELTAELWQAMK